MSLIVNPVASNVRASDAPSNTAPSRGSFAEDTIEDALECLHFDEEIASHSVRGECPIVIHDLTNAGCVVIR